MNQDFDFDTYVALMAETLDIPIAPADRPGVAAQVQRTADLAAEVLTFDAPQDLEAAPVFKA